MAGVGVGFVDVTEVLKFKTVIFNMKEHCRRTYLNLLRITSNPEGLVHACGYWTFLDHYHPHSSLLLKLFDCFSSFSNDQANLGSRDQHVNGHIPLGFILTGLSHYIKDKRLGVPVKYKDQLVIQRATT